MKKRAGTTPMRAPGTITTARGISIALALVIAGAAWRAAEKFADSRENLDQTLNERLQGIEDKFLSKDVFQSEMASLRREADMRQEEVMRRLDAVERRIEGPK